MDPALDTKASKPQDGKDWRRGFKVIVFSESALGGIREFATTAVGAGKGIFELYDQYEAEAEQHFNQVPVVQYVGSTAARIGKGNTNIPNFKIVKWTARPAALPFNNGLPEKPAYRDHQAPLTDDGDPNDKIEL